jgi:DNA-binding NtrC family response regulator
MQISDWTEKRRKKGTLANTARRILASDRTYAEAERQLRRFYMLEALLQSGGNRQKAAMAIGVAESTISRSMGALGVRITDVRRMAKAIQLHATAAKEAQ